jgi:hypothetical protein
MSDTIESNKYPEIFVPGDYAGLVVDKVRSHSAEELELDLIEDVFENEFRRNGMLF